MKSSADDELDEELVYAQQKAAKKQKITDEWYKQLEKEPKAGKDGGNRVKFSDQVEVIETEGDKFKSSAEAEDGDLEVVGKGFEETGDIVNPLKGPKIGEGAEVTGMLKQTHYS